MKIMKYLFTVLILSQFLQSCKNKRSEEFVSLRQVQIDSSHFTVLIYSKTVSDSTILYKDTIAGKLKGAAEFKTEWFNDSVKCIVPNYIPENNFRTHTNLKVILKHRK